MIRFRKDVLLVPRDFGGAFLIDLAGESYAIPAEQAPFAAMLSSGTTTDADVEPAAIPDEFLEELSGLSLIEQPHSFRSRSVTLLNRFRVAFIVICLHAVFAVSRSPHTLTSRLLTLAYFILKCCPWPVTVETWAKFFNRRSSSPRWLKNQMTVDRAGELVHSAAARHFFSARCKERSLTLFALCRLSGHSARVHVGCCPTVFQLHCWLESDDRIVGDDASLCADFNTIATWS